MARIQIDGQWLDVVHFDTDKQGYLLACRVLMPNGKERQLLVRRSEWGLSEFLQFLVAVASAGATGGALGDKYGGGRTRDENQANAIGGALMGGLFGAGAFFLAMKDEGYYDATDFQLVVNGLIHTPTSPRFRR